jgi:hypothetical protein
MYMRVRIAAGVIAVFALAGCGGQDKPAAQATAAASSAPTSSSAPSQVTTTPAAAPAKGDKPDKQFLVGKWGTNGDCALAIELRPDGTSDGPFGNWTYNDGVIGFVDEPDFKVSVTVIDDATMQSTNGDGKTSTMTRCP